MQQPERAEMNTSTGGGAVCRGWQRGRGFGAVTGRGGGAGCTTVNRRHGLGVQVNVEKGWERPSVAELAGGPVTGSRGRRPVGGTGPGLHPWGPAWTASELKVQRLLECLFTGEHETTGVPTSRTVRPEEQDLGIWNILSLSTVPKGKSLSGRELEGHGPGTRMRCGSR